MWSVSLLFLSDHHPHLSVFFSHFNPPFLISPEREASFALFGLSRRRKNIKFDLLFSVVRNVSLPEEILISPHPAPAFLAATSLEKDQNEKVETTRQPVADHQPGCCDVFIELLRACGLICYVACPPVPSVITRKLAFHPPERGMTYRIAMKSDPEKRLKNIRGCRDEPIQLVVRNISNGADYIHSEREVEVFSVTTSNKNDLVCIKCSPDNYSNNPAVSDQVVLFCQPNSSDLGGFLQPNSMNFVTYANVFETDFYAFDYSGYGFSSGTQGEKNMYADIRAVYEKIREMRPDKKIIIMGYSIGTTAAVDLASSNPEGLAGVVLIAPFTSGLRLFSKKPDKPDTCWADSFTSFDKINRIDTRVLICHGDLDEVIPLAHGMALYEKLKNPVPPLIVHGANHHTILSGKYIHVFTRIASFLRHESLVSCRSTEVDSQESSTKKTTDNE